MKLGEKLALIRPGQAWRVIYSNDGSETLEWSDEAERPSDDELLEAAKKLRASEITVSRNKALQSLVASWDGDTWDANEETSNRIANALSMVREAGALGIPTPPAIPWRTYDNKDRTLTIAELTQMGAAVFLAQQMVWAKQAQLKNAIDAAKTEAEVNAIEW